MSGKNNFFNKTYRENLLKKIKLDQVRVSYIKELEDESVWVDKGDGTLAMSEKHYNNILNRDKDFDQTSE